MKLQLKIEDKLFAFALQKVGNRITIEEWGFSYYSKAFFSKTMADCLTTQIRSAAMKGVEGYSNTLREKDTVLIFSIRSNLKGMYLSVLCISKNNNMSLCLPSARNNKGWTSFADLLERIASHNPTQQPIHQDISMESMGGTERLIVRSPLVKKYSNLSETAIMVFFSNFAYSWSHLIGDLENMLDFSQTPKISPVGGNSYVINCNNKLDADQILMNPDRVIDGYKLSFRRWNIKLGTMQPSRHKERWIELLGLPVHLLSIDVATKICSKFGIVKKIRTPQGIPNRITCLQVLIQNPDIYKIPHYLLMVDNNNTFLIRISVPVLEIYPYRKSSKTDEPVIGVNQCSTTLPDAVGFNPEPDPFVLVPPLPSIPQPGPSVVPFPSARNLGPPSLPAANHSAILNFKNTKDWPSLSAPVLNADHLSSPLQSTSAASNPIQSLSLSTPLSSPLSIYPTSPALPAASPPLPGKPSDQVTPLSNSLSSTPSAHPHPSITLVSPIPIFGSNPIPTILDREGSTVVGEALQSNQIDTDDRGLASDSGDESDNHDIEFEGYDLPPQDQQISPFVLNKLAEASSILGIDPEERQLMLDNIQGTPIHSGVSGDVADQLVEEEFDPTTLQDPNQLTDFISKKLVELNEIVDSAAASNSLRESLTAKNLRKRLTRSGRRRKRGTLCLQAEELY